MLGGEEAFILSKKHTDKKTANLESKKANKVQEGWLRPTLINGATENPERPVRFRKDEFGVVYLRGEMTLKGANFYSFNLPLGYGVAEARYYAVATSSRTATQQVYLSPGGLYVYNNSHDFLTLDSIFFNTN